ncbi:MAG: hypothetical protein AAF737_04360 [Pseudomonadota bacterium]
MIMRWNFGFKCCAVLLAGVVAILTTPAIANARPLVGVLPVPDLDYQFVCVRRSVSTRTPALTRDWSLWAGGTLDVSLSQALSLAAEYRLGSSRVAK